MINVTSHRNVPAVGQPTENTPDTYSLVDTTEKVVEEQVVDESLLTSQRIIDSRLGSIDPWDTNTPLRDKLRNKDEACYWSDISLQDIGLGFEADEEIPSGENIKGQFDKRNFWINSTKQLMM